MFSFFYLTKVVLLLRALTVKISPTLISVHFMIDVFFNGDDSNYVVNGIDYDDVDDDLM